MDFTRIKNANATFKKVSRVKNLLAILAIVRRHERNCYEEWALAIQHSLSAEQIEARRFATVKVSAMSDEVSARVITALTEADGGM